MGKVPRSTGRMKVVAAWMMGALVGCGDPPHPGAATLEGLPTLTVVETLRLGSVDDPEIGFSRVGGVDVDREGNLFVVEALDRQIRAYDGEGRLLRRFGGEGEGPGEFADIWFFGVQGDTVWVLDIRQQRTTLFDRQGALLSTASWEAVSVETGPGSTLTLVPHAMRTDGLFTGGPGLVGVSMGGGEGPVPDSMRTPRVLFDGSGAVVDTVGWQVRPYVDRGPATTVEVGVREYAVPRPPRDDPLEAVFSGGRWVVERPTPTSPELATFRAVRIGLLGDTLVDRQYLYTPRAYPDEVLDSIALGRVRVEGQAREAVRSAIRDAMDHPAFQMPVASLVAGSDGTLWLQREDRGGGAERWLVLAPDGTPRGHVSLSREVRLRWVGGSELITVESDDLDVPWVVRSRLRG